MADETIRAKDPRRIYAVIAFALTILGAAIAGYLLWEHWTGGQMIGCSKNALFDCEQVNRSVYSEFKGIPFALLGLAGYLIMAVLCGRRLAVGPEEGDGSMSLVFFFAAFALLVDGFLGYVQIGRIHHYCPWCLSTYVVSLGILVCSVLALGSPSRILAALRKDWDDLEGARVYAYGLLLVIVVAAGFVVLREPAQGTPSVCVFSRICTNAPGDGVGIQTPWAAASERAKAIEKVEKAPFLDPGPAGGYSKGGSNPQLVIVEFGDLECPACRHFSWTMDKFLANHPNDVRWVFRHYPLDQLCNPNVHRKIHEFACTTARAAEAAGMQGKFWEYEGDVYKPTDEEGKFIDKVDLTDASLLARAGKLGLDVEKWKKDKDDDKIISKIVDDIQMGAQVGIESTPTLFVNGRMISGGVDNATLEIYLELAKKGELDPKGPKKTSAQK